LNDIGTVSEELQQENLRSKELSVNNKAGRVVTQEGNGLIVN
jgi:hypothetical protein